MIIEYQRNILADKARNQAFYRALQRVIKPGVSVVADVGSGTGLLGFMASQLGAKSVYLYEFTPVIKLSQKLARLNKIPRCHFIPAHSASVEKPVKADIIVSETLGNYAYEENIIETIEDARRFLKPDGVILPQGIRQFVAPVINSRFYQELCSWDEIGFELDFAPAKNMTLNNMYVRTFVAEDLLQGKQAVQSWDSVEFSRHNKSQRKSEVQWRIEQQQTIYGLAIWWECRLWDDIALSTSPHANLTHWEQLYLPVLTPLQAHAGDILQVMLHSDTRYEIGVNVKWQMELRRGNQIIDHQSMDMRQGDLP